MNSPNSIFAINPLAGMRPAQRPLPLIRARGPVSDMLMQAIAEANRLRNQIEVVKAKIRSAPQGQKLDTWYGEGEMLFQQWKKLYLQIESHIG